MLSSLQFYHCFETTYFRAELVQLIVSQSDSKLEQQRYRDTQQRRRLRHSSMVSSIARCGIADHASTNWCFSLHCCVSAEGGHFKHKLGHLRRHCEFEWFCPACTFLSLTLWLLLTEQIHKYTCIIEWHFRCGEQHNMKMLQIFSATFLPNIVQFGQHLAKLFSK